ncbi:MAG: MBL fold metallo-hydrolase [Verrucomicrobiae bacterium]|nr:MBL fold metallo-hydrolase [Verrucomicrobiae bacterium]
MIKPEGLPSAVFCSNHVASMLFTNLTRASEIGANCYHLQWDDEGCLLDCGAHPKIEGGESLPRLDLLRNRPVDALCVSHGHLDHLGAVPVAARECQDIPIFATYATTLIADRALHNSVNVMTRQRDELRLPEYPLFTHGEVNRLLERFQPVAYGRPVPLGEAEITFYEAGHIQGAAGIWIEFGDESVFYTGDVKFSDMRITRGARFPERPPRTMIIECTRGGTPSQPGFTWDREIERLTAAIEEVFARGGSVLIPCFALGKTQEVLKLFHDLFEEGRMDEQPIFIGGLSRSYTEIYDELADRSPRVCPGFRLQKKMDLVVVETREARAMHVGRGRLLVVSSGMMTPFTMSHLMARRVVERESNAVFFVGYVDPESPAGKLKAGGTGARVDLGGDVGEVEVRSRVESFDFTSHCNREHMLDCVLRLRPRNVLLVHGDPAGIEWYRQQLAVLLPEARVIVPPSGQTVDLS